MHSHNIKELPQEFRLSPLRIGGQYPHLPLQPYHQGPDESTQVHRETRSNYVFLSESWRYASRAGVLIGRGRLFTFGGRHKRHQNDIAGIAPQLGHTSAGRPDQRTAASPSRATAVGEPERAGWR